MDELVLTTDSKRRLRGDAVAVCVIFAVVTAVSAYVLLGAARVSSFVLVELFAALAMGWTVYKSYKNGAVTLHFKGDVLTVSYSDGRKYSIKDVDRGYFKLTQTEKEKRLDLGSLLIESTNFKLRYIKEFSRLRLYVSSHFERVAKSVYYFDDDDGEE